MLLFGVAGYVLLGWKPFDALYMVVITLSTVGYGEVQPVESFLERSHTILLIALGTLAVGYTLSALISFITEGEIQHFLGSHRVRKQIQELKDHVIVAGYGRMGRLLCAELRSAGVPFILIDRTDDLNSEFESLDILYLTGDATDEDLLRAAGLERAKALVTTIPSDAENVFITLTAREMAPHVQIVARAEQPSTQKKLIQAGANQVVLPSGHWRQPDRLAADEPVGRRVHGAGDQAVAPGHPDGGSARPGQGAPGGQNPARRRHRATHRRDGDRHQAGYRQRRVSPRRRYSADHRRYDRPSRQAREPRPVPSSVRLEGIKNKGRLVEKRVFPWSMKPDRKRFRVSITINAC